MKTEDELGVVVLLNVSKPGAGAGRSWTSARSSLLQLHRHFQVLEAPPPWEGGTCSQGQNPASSGPRSWGEVGPTLTATWASGAEPAHPHVPPQTGPKA